jgi:hypothetical protein
MATTTLDDDTKYDEFGNPIEDGDGDGDDVEKLQHKFDVLQGKYNAEVGRMNSVLATTLAENADMRTKLAGAGGGTKTTTFEDTSGGFEGLEEVMKDHPEIFRGVKAVVDAETKKVREELEGKISGVAQSTQTVVTGTILSTLDKDIPGWKKLNTDQKFNEWLAQPDRYTGAPRKELLKNAFNSGNIASTKAFFEDYAKVNSIDLGSGNTETFDFIAPDTSGGGVPRNMESRGAIVNRADIQRFYDERARGNFQGTEEDAKKQEAKIMRAIKEGRVR